MHPASSCRVDSPDAVALPKQGEHKTHAGLCEVLSSPLGLDIAVSTSGTVLDTLRRLKDCKECIRYFWTLRRVVQTLLAGRFFSRQCATPRQGLTHEELEEMVAEGEIELTADLNHGEGYKIDSVRCW